MREWVEWVLQHRVAAGWALGVADLIVFSATSLTLGTGESEGVSANDKRITVASHLYLAA